MDREFSPRPSSRPVFGSRRPGHTVVQAALIAIATSSALGILVVIIAAFKEVGFHVPLVVRLEGTNVEQGRKMLADSGLNIATANGLTEAAKKVVAAAKG